MKSTVLDEEAARYPLGRFQSPLTIGRGMREEWIQEVSELPAALRAAVADLNNAQLDTPYRTGGWTVRQVVHHVADSHMNSYVRFRLALTEDAPSIKAYEEGLWAELPDAKSGPIGISLNLLEGLHARWVLLLEAMSDDDFRRGVRHSQLGEVKLDWMLGLYAWHGRHHVAHIESVRRR